MEKEFVTYEQALALKKLGFDEPCCAYVYTGDTGNNIDRYEETEPSRAINFNHDSLCISQPLKQQAILFLLNKCDSLHGGELSIEYFSDGSGILNNYGLPFKSILEAIDKLIGLANDKIV